MESLPRGGFRCRLCHVTAANSEGRRVGVTGVASHLGVGCYEARVGAGGEVEGSASEITVWWLGSVGVMAPLRSEVMGGLVLG